MFHGFGQPKVLAHTPDLRTLNPRNDLTTPTDQDQRPTLILGTKVMGLFSLIHLATSIDPTVLIVLGILHREFQPFDSFLKNLCEMNECPLAVTFLLQINFTLIPFEYFKGTTPSKLL
jgi:hypothetical protein